MQCSSRATSTTLVILLAEAVQLFNDTLAQLRETEAAVVAIVSNHDSHARVSIYDSLLSSFGVKIRGDVLRPKEPLVVSLRLGGSPVAFYPLPQGLLEVIPTTVPSQVLSTPAASAAL